MRAHKSIFVVISIILFAFVIFLVTPTRPPFFAEAEDFDINSYLTYTDGTYNEFTIDSEVALQYLLDDANGYNQYTTTVIFGKNITITELFTEQEVKLNIQGNNKRLLRGTYLTSSIFGTISGYIKNLDIELDSLSDTESGIISKAISSSGELDNVMLFCRWDTKAKCAFTEVNDGVINNCVNFIKADVAFCLEGTGDIKYCVDDTDYKNVFAKITADYMIYTVNDASDVIENVYIGTHYVADYEHILCSHSSATFEWYQGDTPITDTFSDVDDYTVKITIGEIDIIQIFSIAKISYQEHCTNEDLIVFSGIDGFTDLEYTYVGAPIEISEPDLDSEINAQLLSDGFSYDYTISGEVLSVGTYTQTFIATSRNFLDIVFTRKITVKPALITAKLNDLTIKYNQAVDFSLITTIDEVGMVGVDAGKSIADLLNEESKDFYQFLSTDYVLGDNVGEYNLKFNLNAIKNYNLTISSGTLTVDKEDIDLTGIEFNDVTVSYDGVEKKLLATNVPEGYEVTYVGNTYKDVTNSTATAEFYLDDNHTTAVLTANITVTPATIRVKPTDVTKDFGSIYRSSDFSFEFSGMMQGDDISNINGDNQFLVTAFDDNVTLSEGDTPNAGAYVVRASTDAMPKNANYQYEFVDGSLTINKISLTAFYKNNVNGNNDSFDDFSVDYDESAHTRTIDAFDGTDFEVNVTYEYYQGSNLVSECIAVGEYLIVGTVTPIENTLTARNYATTVYQCKLTINRISTSIAFLEESYTFEYAYNLEEDKAVDYALSDAFQYTTTNIPDGAVVKTYCEQGKADRVGTFLFTAEYEGDENHAPSIARVYFYVTTKDVALNVNREFIYNANPIAMTIKSYDYVGKSEGNLTQDDFTFTYVNNKHNAPVEYVASAGEYTVNVTCKDANYNLLTKSFVITVNKLAVDVNLGNIIITYGDMGEVVLDNGAVVYVYDNYVSYLNYYVASTDKNVNVSFGIPKIEGTEYFSANTYELSTSNILEDDNYVFNLVGNNVLTVKQRTLSINWYVDGKAVYTGNTAFVYAGENLNSKITYGFVNYAAKENVNNVTSSLEIRKSGVKTDLLHAGTYNLRIVLNNTPNYVLDLETNAFNVDIIQVTLSVTINDASVMQYENFYMPTFTINGLRGADKDVPLLSLDGYSFKIDCAYNKDTARVGDTFTIGGAFTFTDYVVPTDYVYAGTLTVVDGYPEYVLPSATYVYDGTEKRVILSDVMEGVNIRYENNVQRYVGNYNVIATVTYPTGRTVTLRSTLTILQAEPVINVEAKFTAYRQDYEITSDYLTATATTPSGSSLAGSFAFTTEHTLLRGENKYKAKFTPMDSYNYKTVTFDVTITAYVIDGGLIKISGGDYSYEDGSLVINKTMLLTLDRTTIEPITKQVSLLKDQAVVQSITLNKEETFTLRIKYLDEILYTEEYNVKFVTGEIDGDVEEVQVGSSMISFSSATLNKQNNTIYVDTKGGELKLLAEHKPNYTLYVNDTMVETYTFNGEESSISIIIKSKTLGVSVYAQVFKVEWVEDPNNLPNQDGTNIEEQPKVVWQDWYGAVIGGVGGAIVLAVVLIFILRRRK